MQVAVSMDTVDHRKSPGSLCSIYVYNRTYLEGHCRPGSIQFGFITEMYLKCLKRMCRVIAFRKSQLVDLEASRTGVFEAGKEIE